MTILQSGVTLPISVAAGNSLVIKELTGTATVTGSTAPREDASVRIGAGFFVYGPQASQATLSISTTGLCDYQVVAGDPTPANQPLLFDPGNPPTSGPTLSGDAAVAVLKAVPYKPLGGSGAASAVTGVTTAATLASIIIPGGSLGPNGVLELTTLWSMTSNANVKTPRVALGGQQLQTSTGFASNAQSQLLLRVYAKNSNNQQLAHGFTNPYGVAAPSLVSTTLDMSVDQPLVITGQLATSTDVLTLEAWSLLIKFGA